MMNAKTIQIYLPDGNPRGIKVVELPSRTVKAIMIPRSLLLKAGEREELSNVGIYLLFSDEDPKPFCYIGEAEDCFSRLKQHNNQKDWWTHAIAFVSTNQHFTKSHVRYLEYVAYQKALQAGRYALQNGNIPSQPHIHETVLADIADVFSTIRMLASLLGYPLFDELGNTRGKEVIKDALQTDSAVENNNSDNYIYLKAKGVEARGQYTEEGLVVFKGSQAAIETVQSAQPYLRSMREDLLAKHILELKDYHLEFLDNYVFSSPSFAASVVRGGASNGWFEWKYEDGRTLDEVHRQQIS